MKGQGPTILLAIMLVSNKLNDQQLDKFTLFSVVFHVMDLWSLTCLKRRQ